jgi:hypothetical protein
MRCEQFRELISAYIERSVAPPLAERMEQHASSCDACRAALEGVEAVWQMMARASRVEPPALLHERIMQEVTARIPIAPTVRWWELAWRPRFAFAAAAVLIVFAVGLWSYRQVTTDAIALSVVSTGSNPVSRVSEGMLPVRIERLRSDNGDLRWMLRCSPARPTNVAVTVGAQTVWSGTIGQETLVMLPDAPKASVLNVQVTWHGDSMLRAWLPETVLHGDRKPVLLLREKSIEQTLAQVAQAYGVPLVLVGETNPLTRVNLESIGVSLEEMLSKLSEKLKLEISRAEDGTIVLTAR